MQPQQSYIPPVNPTPVMPVQGGPDQKQKLIIVGVGALLGLGLLIFMASLIFGGDESRAILDRSVAYHQEELRVNKLVDKYGTDEDFDLFAFKATLDILVTSDMTGLQTVLGEDGVSEDAIEAVTDTEVVTRFEEAVSLNSFTDEYVETMSVLIEKNLVELRKLEKLANPDTKKKVEQAIINHESLLKQLEDL